MDTEERVIWEDDAASGPLCAYWYEEDAQMCGHASCYIILEPGNV